MGKDENDLVGLWHDGSTKMRHLIDILPSASQQRTLCMAPEVSVCCFLHLTMLFRSDLESEICLSDQEATMSR